MLLQEKEKMVPVDPICRAQRRWKKNYPSIRSDSNFLRPISNRRQFWPNRTLLLPRATQPLSLPQQQTIAGNSPLNPKQTSVATKKNKKLRPIVVGNPTQQVFTIGFSDHQLEIFRSQLQLTFQLLIQGLLISRLQNRADLEQTYVTMLMELLTLKNSCLQELEMARALLPNLPFPTQSCFQCLENFSHERLNSIMASVYEMTNLGTIIEFAKQVANEFLFKKEYQVNYRVASTRNINSSFFASEDS